MLTLKEVLEKEMQDPEFCAEWDALEPEFQAYRATLKASEAQEEAQDQISVGRIRNTRRSGGLQARP